MTLHPVGRLIPEVGRNATSAFGSLSCLTPYPILRPQLSMERRYKKKALWGVAAWFLSPVLALVPGLLVLLICYACNLSSHKSGNLAAVTFLVATVVIFYFAFFWGGG